MTEHPLSMHSAPTAVIAVVWRRGFCGWICPFGGIQELLGLAGRKLFGRQLFMTQVLDKPLRYRKYGILLPTAALAWITGTLWLSPYDPWAAYAHVWEGFSSLIAEFPVGFSVLIVTAVGSFVYNRFFMQIPVSHGSVPWHYFKNQSPPDREKRGGVYRLRKVSAGMSGYHRY